MTGSAPGAAPLPDIEPVWVVEATYCADVAERRTPVRAEHLAGVVRGKAAGTILEAGAYADLSGSLLIVRAADEQAALDIARADVYFQDGVWTEVTARAFGRVV